MRRLFIFALILVSIGCKTGVVPDPNDPKDGPLSAERLRTNLAVTAQMLNDRWIKGEITDAQVQQFLTRRANDLLRGIQVDRLDPSVVWEYADILRTAKRWPEAVTFLRVAVQHPPNEDRRVNDTLRLAQALCYTDKVAEAIPLARTVFNAKPAEKAPILPSVLLEIVPAAEGKGHDAELAQLLEDAIYQHQMVIVDPKSEGGQAFLQARPHHTRRAWGEVIRLFDQSGHPDKATEAGKKSTEMLAGQASVRRNRRSIGKLA